MNIINKNILPTTYMEYISDQVTLVDAVNKSYTLSHKIHNFKTEQGMIYCGINAFKNIVNNDFGDDMFILYYIDIYEQFRGQHIFSNLLRHIATNDDINVISICGVGSRKLTDILNKFRINNIGFICQGGDYSWFRTTDRQRKFLSYQGRI